MTDLSALKVYSPGYDATHWGFDYPQIVDLETALAQPTKIAVLPVYFNRPTEFSFRPEYLKLDLEKFDLVLFTDIEFRSQQELVEWIETTGVTNWLLCVGGLWRTETLGPRTVYKPTWSFNFLQWNESRDDFPLERPFLFDCLCGTRRKHRDYAVLSLIQSGLIDRTITTYRDIFVGGEITETPPEVAAEFPGLNLPWPYVSPNLDPAWEVRPNLDNSISGIVPWEIYNRTYYSMLVETLGYGDTFLMAEKIGKCLFARRVFVHFGTQNWLKQLKSFGFQTFDSVVDESYDDIENNVSRWRKAFEQVQALAKLDPQKVYQKVMPVLDHNRARLYEFREEKKRELQSKIADYLK